MQIADQEYKRKVKTTVKRTANNISTYAPTPAEPPIEMPDSDASKKHKTIADSEMHSSPTMSDLIDANAELVGDDETKDALLLADDESDPASPEEKQLDINTWKQCVDQNLVDIADEKPYREGLFMLSDCLERIDFASSFDIDAATLLEVQKQAAEKYVAGNIRLAEKQLSSNKIGVFETGFNLLKKIRHEFLSNENNLLTTAQKEKHKKTVTPLLSKATYKLAKHYIKDGNKSKGAILLGEAIDYGNIDALWDLFDVLTTVGHDAYQQVQTLLNIGLPKVKASQADLIFEKAIPKLLELGKHYMGTATTIEQHQNTLEILRTAAELMQKFSQTITGRVAAMTITQKMEIASQLASAQCKLGIKIASTKEPNYEQNLHTAITHYEASLKSRQFPETELALGTALYQLGKILLRKTPITVENQQLGINHLTRSLEIKERADEKPWVEGRKFVSEQAYLFAQRCLQEKNPASVALALKQLDISVTAYPTGNNLFLLGVIYANSDYGKKDLKKAQHFFTEASKRKHPEAAKRLEQIAAFLKQAPAESISNRFYPQ